MLNTSNTAMHHEMSNLFTAPALGAMAGHEAGGLRGALVGGALGGARSMAGYGGAQAVSSPWLTQFMARPGLGPDIGVLPFAGTYGGAFPALIPQRRAPLSIAP